LFWDESKEDNKENDLSYGRQRYTFQEEDDDDLEAKKERLTKNLDRKFVNKQNLVRKDGKGKYHVTVPIPFEF